MRASQAGVAAADAAARKLLLTHLPAERDVGLSLAEAQKSSGDAEVQLAADGLRLEVGR
jgi:ribonuclease BN (tRNA processing enzyme)